MPTVRTFGSSVHLLRGDFVPVDVHNGQLNEAIQMFQKMLQQNVVTWTAMISSCTHQGMLKEARIFFDQMPKRNLYSWNAMFAAYAKLGHLKEAASIFEQMPERDGLHFGSPADIKEGSRLMEYHDNSVCTTWLWQGGSPTVPTNVFRRHDSLRAININGILYACAHPCNLSFWKHFKFGFPSTRILVAVGLPLIKR